MELKTDSYSESLLEREYVHVQRVYYPITVCFTFIDSSTIASAKYRLIKLSPALERVFKLKMNSPEDNLKLFRYSPVIAAIILAGSFVLSAALPFVFMMVAASTQSASGFELVTYWIFWASLLFGGLMLLWNYWQSRKRVFARRTSKLIDEYRVRKSQLKPIFLESLVLYFYLTILFYTSTHIENVLICHVQVIALALSFCFKVGRNLTLTRNLLYAFAGVAGGLVLSVAYFGTLKDDYSSWKGVLAIFGAFLGGLFWLKNHDGADETNLYVKLLVINIMNVGTSLILTIFFCSFGGLFAFLFARFWSLVIFVLMLFFAFYLKSQVVLIYEDLIPTMLYTFEPLLLYFYWEIFVRLGQTESAGLNVWSEFISFLFSKFLVVVAIMIAPQLWAIVEMKRNELNFEGGKIGMKGVERDQMKLEHLKLIKRLNLERL